jgi:hypothetical protein
MEGFYLVMAVSLYTSVLLWVNVFSELRQRKK